jgi:hypothetical protein
MAGGRLSCRAQVELIATNAVRMVPLHRSATQINAHRSRNMTLPPQPPDPFPKPGPPTIPKPPPEPIPDPPPTNPIPPTLPVTEP